MTKICSRNLKPSELGIYLFIFFKNSSASSPVFNIKDMDAGSFSEGVQ